MIALNRANRQTARRTAEAFRDRRTSNASEFPADIVRYGAPLISTPPIHSEPAQPLGFAARHAFVSRFRAKIAARRALPGKVLARLNQKVSPTDVLAEPSWAREHILLDVARLVDQQSRALDQPLADRGRLHTRAIAVEQAGT